MEDILGKILLSAVMCAATGGDPEVESKKCADEIMKDLKEGKIPPEDMKWVGEIMEIIGGAPMCIKIEGIPWPTWRDTDADHRISACDSVQHGNTVEERGGNTR